MNGLQTGAVQIIFILPVFNESAETRIRQRIGGLGKSIPHRQPAFFLNIFSKIKIKSVFAVQYSLSILDVGLESCFSDEVVLDSFSLVTLPGSSRVLRERKEKDNYCLGVTFYKRLPTHA